MKLIDKDKVIEVIETQGAIQPQLSWFTDKLIQTINSSVEVKEVNLEEEDAFIEEAIGWIDYNNRNGGCFFDGWEKDFRKYIKGE